MSPKKMVAKDSAAKRKKDTISIELKIIGKHKRGLRVANLAKLYGCLSSTISTPYTFSVLKHIQQNFLGGFWDLEWIN